MVSRYVAYGDWYFSSVLPKDINGKATVGLCKEKRIPARYHRAGCSPESLEKGFAESCRAIVFNLVGSLVAKWRSHNQTGELKWITATLILLSAFA